MAKIIFSRAQIEDLAKILVLIRHVRNLTELGPHSVRIEGVEAEDTFTGLVGKENLEKIYRSKTWSSFTP